MIGVECHIQIKHTHKLFSNARLPLMATTPNALVSAFDAAHPGTLPTLNQSALRLAVSTALALNCIIHPESRFDRKHYFYSDLPAGYQITQKYSPLANNGKVHLRFDEGYLPSVEEQITVDVEQVQLEQDTAKSSYFDTGLTSRTTTDSDIEDSSSQSFVDLNRAGTGLMEIVSGPQMRTPEQAGAYVRKLQELVRRVGASDGNMQEGSLRCDVNVSVNRDHHPFGTRCEIKNLNSVRFMMNAISFESHRQVALLQNGGTVEQETRGYNEANGNTFRLRGKEEAPDYRYMPDPNLPPILLSARQISDIQRSLPELPDACRSRLHEQYGLNSRDINVLMRVGTEDEGAGRTIVKTNADVETQGVAVNGIAKEVDAVEYFEQLAKGRDAQTALNWIIHELLKILNARNWPFRASLLPPAYLGELLDLVESGQCTGTTARSVVEQILDGHPAISLSVLDQHRSEAGSASPVFDVLAKCDLLALNTKEALAPLVSQAIQQLPAQVAEVRKGNLKVATRIVGQVMKDANGRADAKLVHQVILEQLQV